MRRRSLFRNRSVADPSGKFTNSWSMDENSGLLLSDSIGGLDFDYPADLAASSVQGQVNNAIQFDLQGYNAQTSASTDFSWIVENSGVLEARPFTVMFWGKDTGGSFNPIMSIGSGGFYPFYFRKSSNIYNCLMRYKKDDGTEVNLDFDFGAFHLNNTEIRHLALVFDPYKVSNTYQMTLYRNGNEAIVGVDHHELPTNLSGGEAHPFTVGGYGYTGSRTTNFAGLQDEIKLAMGHAFSAEEIKSVYDSEI